MFSNSKNNYMHNRDFNIDQNNCDYHSFNNRAALGGTPRDRASVID